MSNRSYRFILGLILLLACYFDWRQLIYGIVIVVLFEGVTNLRLPFFVNVALGRGWQEGNMQSLGAHLPVRFAVDAERCMRLMFAIILYFSFAVYQETLWFFPWLMGFFVMGSGISGLCPMVLFFRWLGFR